MSSHAVAARFPRDGETLDVRAVCECGEVFEHNNRKKVVDMVADHLIETTNWEVPE